jgi:crotonobetainyl-CoA:carnitine CoA-transferase CaiB-like acyl-CoA transferase
MLLDIQHPLAKGARVINMPPHCSEAKFEQDGFPPLLGQHNLEILTELLGYSPTEVAQMTVEGALDAEEEVLEGIYELLE